MKRLKKPKITCVSLVKSPHNRLTAVVKGDGTFELAGMCKGSEDGSTLYSCVYVPDASPDAEGDVADAETVKEMAYSHMESGAALDVRHDMKPLSKSEAFVAESFIIQKGDPRFAGWTDVDNKPVDVTGGWGQVILLRSEALREQFRKGELRGVSMFGTAQREPVEKGMDLFEAFKSFFLGHAPAKQEIHNMPLTAEEKAEIVKGVVDAVKPLLPVAPAPVTPAAPAAAKPEDGPVFKGDLSKAEDIAAFERELEDSEIRKGMTSADPAVRAKALERAKERLKKGAPAAPAPSNAPAGDVLKGDTEDPECAGFFAPAKK